MTTIPSPEPEDEAQYHSIEELREALNRLEPTDWAKLDIVANYFWKSRGLRDSHGDPQELLSQAVVRSLLPGGKRWRYGVSVQIHLRQAMKNISGQWASRGDTHSTGDMDEDPTQEQTSPSPGPDRIALSRERLLRLRQHFGPDEEAFTFLLHKAGSSELEAAAKMGLSPATREAVARRVRRKLNRFLERGEVPL